jgi:octaprenyl-diphosphate synthase
VTTSTPGLSSPAKRSELNPETFLTSVLPKLQLVEEELRRNFNAEIRTLREVGDHILQGGGKRLRPALLLLVSDMLGYDGLRDVTYGAVIELIHTATLIHDDIIDEAEVRRGRTSINHRWGNEVTVLVGDYLYTHAMKMAIREGDIEVLDLLINATSDMIGGEILGLETNGRADISTEEYFDIVRRKTAALFGASCRIPAHLIGAPEAMRQKLHDFGYNLGVGFQLIDDLLDFTSSTEVLGKPALSDLKEGKLTLPLILAQPRATEHERGLIERVLRDRSFESVDSAEIVNIATRYDAVEETREIARDYITRAREALTGFAPSESRDALNAALEFVVARER